MQKPTNRQIAESWELWQEYVDPGAEDNYERWAALTVEERMAEIEACFGKDEA